MKNRSFLNLVLPRPTTKSPRFLVAAGALLLLLLHALVPRPAVAGDAPAWMHALTNAPLPPHDEKTDAVLLYSEEILMVQANGKLKEIDRSAYKILRPGGRHFGKVALPFDSDSRITSIHGWCIPAPEPGNIVGFEVEHEDRPYVLQDEWFFQESVPVGEARYTLQLPPGWEY